MHNPRVSNYRTSAVAIKRLKGYHTQMAREKEICNPLLNHILMATILTNQLSLDNMSFQEKPVQIS